MVERRIAWTVALVGAFTMTVSYVDRGTLAVLAPSVTEALGISNTEYGWLTSAFSVAYLVAVPISGWWIDRTGARRGLTWSVLVWSAIAALHALVPGFAVLFLLRIALGTAEAPSFPGAAQAMYRMLPPDERPRGYSLLFTGSSVGSMLAPLLASALYGLSGWRVAFLGTAAFGLMWLPLWMISTRRRDVRAQLDTPPAAAPGPRPSFMDLLRNPRMVRALIAIVAAAPVLGFGLTWGSKYLVKEYGVDQGDVGYYLWLPPLGLDAGALLFGYLATRARRPRVLVLAAAALACTVGALPLTVAPWPSTVVFAFALAGGGGLYTLVTADLLSRMPAASVSFAGGILTGAQSLSLIITSPLIGWSVDRFGTYDVAAAVIGAWVLPGCAIWWLWEDQR